MNFRQLNYFRKVIEAGNISAAAESLHLAQTALGGQIRQLERELGVELLIRHSRGVSPTSEGELLYQHSQRILDAVEQARMEVSARKSSNLRHLRLGVGPSMITLLGSEVLMGGESGIPDVKVSLVEERSRALLSALEGDHLDVAFLSSNDERPGIERHALLKEDLVLVTAPSLASADETINLADALLHDLVIGGILSGSRAVVEVEARKLSIKLKLACEMHSISSIKAMVANGKASSIMPYSLCANEIRTGRLVGRRIVCPDMARTVYIAHKSTNSPLLDDQRVQTHVNNIVDSYLRALAQWGRLLPNVAAHQNPEAAHGKTET